MADITPTDDDTLKERFHQLHANKQEILAGIASIKRNNEVPISQIKKPQNIELFCKAFKDLFKNKNYQFGKEYLKFLVDEIVAKGNEITIKGRTTHLAALVQKPKVDTLENRVPTFGMYWLPGTGSNRRPSG